MVKLPSGASEFGMVEAAPNWDDYMTPGGPISGLERERWGAHAGWGGVSLVWRRLRLTGMTT